MKGSLATLVVVAILAAPTPAVPLEPVGAMVDAFRTHAVVAVTAGHGETRGYAFGQLLIHDPRLIAAINDIVIEEGSARYQDVADRFVRGDNVPLESLRHVWRDTTQPGLGYDRQWEEFFQVMRAVNAALPATHKVRVMLGDPPIEWENVKTPEDHRRWIEMRDTGHKKTVQGVDCNVFEVLENDIKKQEVCYAIAGELPIADDDRKGLARGLKVMARYGQAFTGMAEHIGATPAQAQKPGGLPVAQTCFDPSGQSIGQNALSISQEKVAPDRFDIPSDYSKMTMQDNPANH